MTPPNDSEIEALLSELAATDEERAAILEEHRLLEKDLLRLSDPLPPPEFFSQVMARVAQLPAEPTSRADMASALAIVGLALAAAAAALWSTDGLSHIGLSFTTSILKIRDTFVASTSAVTAIWKTAAMPAAIVLSMMLTATLTVMRRLMPTQAAQEVAP